MLDIVPMQDWHLPDLAKIERLCFACPWSEAALKAEIGRENAIFLVALWDNAVAGYGGMYIQDEAACITNICTHPDFRRRHVGSRILADLIGCGWKRNLKSISLEVRTSNTLAIGMYEKQGFAIIGERKHIYTKPLENGYVMKYTYP